MTNDQLKDIFNSAIKAATNADQTAKLEVCREYFTNPEFKKDLTKEGGIKNLEYIDFRFKDKVFYRFKNYKKELATTTPVLITPKPTSSPAVTTVTSGSQTASTSATSTQ